MGELLSFYIPGGKLETARAERDAVTTGLKPV